MEKKLKEYLKYLDSEIEKSEKFGKAFIEKDNDLNGAERWYSIAEAFKVAKENAIKMLIPK